MDTHVARAKADGGSKIRSIGTLSCTRNGGRDDEPSQVGGAHIVYIVGVLWIMEWSSVDLNKSDGCIYERGKCLKQWWTELTGVPMMDLRESERRGDDDPIIGGVCWRRYDFDKRHLLT
jgi:hypothetical protein